MKPSQFGNVCTKFELDPSNENRAIKKIRWVGQIRPGPLRLTREYKKDFIGLNGINVNLTTPIRKHNAKIAVKCLIV